MSNKNQMCEVMKHAFYQFTIDSEHMWLLFQSTNDGLIITDEAEKILIVNPAYEKMSGYSCQELIGQRPSIVKSFLTPKSRYQEMKQDLKETHAWRGELINRRKDGQLFYIDQTITAIIQDDRKFYIAITRDVTDKHERQEALHQLAYYDTLTGLPNQAYLRRVAELAIKQKEKGFSLMLLDIDRFKHINDAHGHHIGDEIINEVANRLNDLFKPDAVVSRYSGDTYFVFLPGEWSKDQLANRLTDVLNGLSSMPFRAGLHEFSLTLSAGISMYPEDGQNVDVLIKHADQAMYRAKDEGRNTYQFFDDQLSQFLLKRIDLVKELREALTNDQFEVYYQPQWSLKDATMIGVEALVRWQHPTRGLLAPIDFLLEAEEYGLLVEIDLVVMQKAFEQMTKWQDEGSDALVVSVNVSQRLFNQPDVVRKINQLIEQVGIKASNVCIEITESVALNKIDHAVETIRAFKKLGVRVALDDFGTGYSSLSQLRNFPFDLIKIDQSFIRSSSGDDLDAAFVEAIIHMAKLFQFQVVAEGVETIEQLAFVRDKKADFVQGYLFQKPVPAHKVLFDCRGQNQQIWDSIVPKK